AGDAKPAGAKTDARAIAPPPSPPRINADAQFDLRIPEEKAAGRKPRSLLQQLAAWRGQARAQLRDSQFGGVPLAGELALESHAARQRLLGHARLEAGGNQLTLDGEIDATAAASDRWKLQVQAPKLDSLAPLLRLLQPGSPPQASAGALSAQAEAEGRWPSLHSRGELQAQGLSLLSWSAAGVRANWDFGTTPEAAVNLQAEISQVALGQRKLDLLRAQLSGTGRSHQASLRIEAPPLRPTNGASQGNGSPLDALAEQRLLALATASGGWSRDERTASLGWQGRVQQLELRALAPGAAQTGNPGTAWLHADPFELSWAGGADSQRLSVSPTRLSVSDAALKLSRLEWSQRAGAAPRFDLQAELEPLKLAPLLARAQPDFGWAGDLTVDGHLALHSDAEGGFRADALLERSAGDLEVVDPAQLGAKPLRLGLSEARFALSANNGLWQFTQQLTGANLGAINGEQTVSTRRELSWPEPAAPLHGQLDIRVANLATWGAWVPPGWRLSGQLATQASVGGRFGAPEYTGHLSGSHIGVRNVLAGVNLSEGEVEIALQGDTARIERFNVRGGQGQARLEGEASLGAAPQARLQLTADHFAVLSRVDRRLSLSGQAQLELQSKALKLDGRLVADSGLVDISHGGAPSLADDVTVVRRGSGDAAAALSEPAKTAPRMSNVALNLKLDLGPDFRLRGHGLDTLLRGELAVTTPGGLMNVKG
ncbi:MAG TPA: translocation/assembly module TamB domain-containing protein, partial [Methylibium sp.]